MKNKIKLIAFLTIVFIAGCSKQVNVNGVIVTNSTQTVIPDEILNASGDSTAFNKNVVFSVDNKIAYVMTQGEDSPTLLYTMQSETEEQEADFATFFMVVIILIIIL